MRVSLGSESELHQLDAAIDKIGGGGRERGGGEGGVGERGSAEGGAEGEGEGSGSLTGCESGMRAMPEGDTDATAKVSVSMNVPCIGIKYWLRSVSSNYICILTLYIEHSLHTLIYLYTLGHTYNSSYQCEPQLPDHQPATRTNMYTNTSNQAHRLNFPLEAYYTARCRYTTLYNNRYNKRYDNRYRPKRI